MRTGDVIDSLQRCGLSRHEAATLLSLARLGAATAGELAKAASVNRVQAYRALDALDARGLVEVTVGRPKLYAARAIDEVFDILADEKRAELEGLEVIRKGLLEGWPKVSGQAGMETSVRLQVIKGRVQIYRALRRLVGGAKREVLAFTTTKGLQRSHREGIHEVLLEGMGRGVKVRLVADVNEGNMGLMARVAQRVPLRHVDRQRGRFIIVDRESILAFLIQHERAIRAEAETALWTNSPDYVKAHLEIFERAWESGVPAARRMAALGHPEPSRARLLDA